MRLLLVLLCGCSLIFTEGPKPETPDKPCNASEAAPVADATFAVLYGIAAFAFVADMDSSSDNGDQVTGVVITGLVAGLFGLSARSGLINVSACRRHNNELYEQQQAAAAAPPEIPRARRDAWQLTKQAAIAARNGDCATVAALEQVVLGLDTEFHGTVFMRDAAIVHCMQTTEVPVQPPGETPPAPAPVAPVTMP
ncbi:MAG TPA: hypothetical protein VFV99_17725 [Kofleriaceae bacterium]|nr:hypothetical protein [Kofleriaceae bacterium]